MNEQKSEAVTGPLPEPDGTLVPPAMGVHGSERYSYGWSAASMDAYARQEIRREVALAVAAERERWEGIVCNALDLYDRLETRRGMEMLADLVAHKRA